MAAEDPNGEAGSARGVPGDDTQQTEQEASGENSGRASSLRGASEHDGGASDEDEPGAEHDDGASDDDERGTEHEEGASERDTGHGGNKEPTGRASNLRGASEHEPGDDECEGSEAAWKQAVHRGISRIRPYSVCRAMFASRLSPAWFVAQEMLPQAVSGSQQPKAPCAG